MKLKVFVGECLEGLFEFEIEIGKIIYYVFIKYVSIFLYKVIFYWLKWVNKYILIYYRLFFDSICNIICVMYC